MFHKVLSEDFDTNGNQKQSRKIMAVKLYYVQSIELCWWKNDAVCLKAQNKIDQLFYRKDTAHTGWSV